IRFKFIDPDAAFGAAIKSKQLLMSSEYALKHYFVLRKLTDDFFKGIQENKVNSIKFLRRELMEILEIAKHSPYQVVALSLIREGRQDDRGYSAVRSQALATCLLSMVLARELEFSTREQVNFGLIGLM